MTLVSTCKNHHMNIVSEMEKSHDISEKKCYQIHQRLVNCCGNYTRQVCHRFQKFCGHCRFLKASYSFNKILFLEHLLFFGFWTAGLWSESNIAEFRELISQIHNIINLTIYNECALHKKLIIITYISMDVNILR